MRIVKRRFMKGKVRRCFEKKVALCIIVHDFVSESIIYSCTDTIVECEQRKFAAEMDNVKFVLLEGCRPRE